MMRYVIILLLALTACSPCRQVVEQSDSVSHVAHERDSVSHVAHERDSVSHVAHERDSVSHVAHERDSVSHVAHERDSVYHRGSIYVYRRGDALFIYKEWQVVNWREQADTTTRVAERDDTTTRVAERDDTTTRVAEQADTTTRVAERADTTTRVAKRREEITPPVAPAPEPIKWYDRGAMWVGRLCLLSLLLWLIFLYIKRKR